MKFYQHLTRRMMQSYIIYVIVFSVIAYIICFFSAAKDYRHSIETVTSSVAGTVSNALNYADNITAVLSEASTISDFIYSDNVLDMAYNANIASSTINTAFSSATNNLQTIGCANLPTKTIITNAGTMQLEYFSAYYDLNYSEIVNTLSAMQNKTNTKPYITTSAPTLFGREENCLTLIMYDNISTASHPIIYIFSMDKFVEIADLEKAQIALSLDGNTFFLKGGFAANPDPGFNPMQITIAKSMQRAERFDVTCSYTTGIFTYIINTNSFFMLFMLILLVMIFVLYVIQQWGIRDIYAPIHSMLNKISPNIPAPENEFEYIESTISNLITEKNTLSSLIQQYEISVLDRFLLNQMNGLLTPDDTAREVAELKLEDTKFPLIVCILEYNNYRELSGSIDTEGLCSLHSSIGYFCEEHFQQANFFRIIDLDMKSHILVLPFTDAATLKNSLVSLALKIESLLGVVLKISMGLPANDFGGLTESYSGASSLSKNMIASSESFIVLSADDISSAGSYSTETESLLINQLLSCDLGAAKTSAYSLVNSALGQDVITGQQHAQLVVMLFSTFSKVLYLMNKTEEEIFGESFSIYLELKQCTSRTQMLNTIYELIDQITAAVKAAKSDNTAREKQAMLDYIHNNYQNEISLLIMASSLNLSQYYLSRQFKELVGENFKDYLAHYRLGKSVELFKENPNAKIKTVAEQVGYNNPETFSRAFQKYYGVLPGKYVERLK